MQNNKYTVIGIDGADYRVFEKMIENGVMPNISKIMRQADCKDVDTYGNALGQGWATLMTGLTPAEHGINYWKIGKGTTSDDFSVPLLWDVLEGNGLTSGLVNLSYTFPPRPIHGFMISGLGGGLDPVSSAKYCYPDGLIDELNYNADGYIWGLARGEGSKGQNIDYLNNLILMTRKRSKACRYLIDTKNTNFFMVVFRGADAIQHSFWKALEIEGPAPSSMEYLKDKITEYYSTLDSAINDLWEGAAPNNRIILSDHGFGPTTCFFRINELLHQHELLFKSFSPKAFIGNKLFNIVKNRFGPFYNRYFSNYSWAQKANKRRAQSFSKVKVAIDWEKTKLYAIDSYGVRYNSKVCDTDYKKIKAYEKFREIIGSCVNPETKKTIFNNYYLKKELSLQNFENSAPDIIFDLSDESCLIEPDIEMKNNAEHFIPIGESHMHLMSGSHRRRGILIADKGYLIQDDSNIKMEDIYSTILDSFEINIPEYAKGKSLIKKN